MNTEAERPGDIEELADVVVIGTGAGGAVVACELAEAGVDVLLLEEGDHPDRVPAGAPPLARIGALYRDGGMSGTSATPITVDQPRGAAPRRSTGTCWRAPEEVLERWEREFGIPALASGGLDDEYARVEKALGVAPVPEELLGPGARLVRRGAQALGFQTTPLPRNAIGCRGTGVCAFGCPRHANSRPTSLCSARRRAGAAAHSAASAGAFVEGGRTHAHLP
jgi:choline dehydrogenase-like flavoprotein